MKREETTYVTAVGPGRFLSRCENCGTRITTELSLGRGTHDLRLAEHAAVHTRQGRKNWFPAELWQ